ncbi:hypothetical protein IQ07DRAFT_644047 [Pyrenochaeta sp. DS3sAY3a]|nr:hypothetical protein IQ07DRAFT_644047 [Pyrenochaeta sp. DS3sAY3a]
MEGQNTCSNYIIAGPGLHRPKHRSHREKAKKHHPRIKRPSDRGEHQGSISRWTSVGDANANPEGGHDLFEQSFLHVNTDNSTGATNLADTHVALGALSAMSSGFVSGGKAGEETERDDAWKAAAQALEDARRAKEDLAKQHDGKSLYEVLQANKDKKQAEFEEKARFHLHSALDDDEADYLYSVREKARLQEASVRKETSEQLDIFRRQQEEAESKALEDESAEVPKEDAGQWAAVGRKRKKGPETSLLKGVKLRKSSSATTGEKKEVDNVKKQQPPEGAAIDISGLAKAQPSSHSASHSLAAASSKPSASSPPAKPSGTVLLGLGYASSDDED